MPRTARVAPGGILFHVLNRGVGRMQIFRAEKDYEAFQQVVEQTLRVAPVRICAYCWMPNHWHFVLWPERDGDLSRFMQRMANMHTQRWQRAKLCVGYGHLYQGRFKSFPIEATNISTAWCGTWSGTHCGPDSLGARRIGNRAVCTREPVEREGRFWLSGRCRNPPTGSSRSTCRRRKRSWTRFADVFVAAVPTATHPGPSRPPSDLGYNRRFTAVVGRARAAPKPSVLRILPNICARPLYPL